MMATMGVVFRPHRFPVSTASGSHFAWLRTLGLLMIGAGVAALIVAGWRYRIGVFAFPAVVTRAL
jgi:hypothetical protein